MEVESWPKTVSKTFTAYVLIGLACAILSLLCPSFSSSDIVYFGAHSPRNADMTNLQNTPDLINFEVRSIQPFPRNNS